jgi:type II secretory ATPase GspE/PulE/Tfp pilus assembly ATPase PilB-like protein
LKALGQIDVAEKRKAQDGRFQTRIENRDVDMRISTAASIFGEKMVIRILDRRGGIFGLAELGMSKEMIDQFNACIHSRSGMILATGPTGAGKTSTLYAAISQLDRKRLNIMSIEDPVEYKLEGATQIPMNANAGVTYESGLRSILRQDPDVILVGEMRDAEAAKIAMRAALTGTLVFSSLHTKDTVNTILRLSEMGIESAQMGSALQMLIAQRLVRVLCADCREPYKSSAEELYDIGIEMPVGETIYRAKGCAECSQTGYRGRTGIFELLVFDDATRAAVTREAGQEEILELARSKGFIGYREAGAHKILSGITTVEEVLEAG